MSLGEFDIGDRIILRATLTDEVGAAVTGATVTARALAPDGTETDLGSASDEGAGVYQATLDPDASGKWEVRFESATPNQAAEEGDLYVRASAFS